MSGGMSAFASAAASAITAVAVTMASVFMGIPYRADCQDAGDNQDQNYNCISKIDGHMPFLLSKLQKLDLQ